MLHARLGGVRHTPAPQPTIRLVDPPPTPAKALDLRGFCLHALGKALRRSLTDVDARVPFRHLGVDSLMAVRLVRGIEKQYGLELHPTLLFEHPTVDDVVRHLEPRLQRRNA
jgi:acyl carrier protein